MPDWLKQLGWPITCGILVALLVHQYVEQAPTSPPPKSEQPINTQALTPTVRAQQLQPTTYRSAVERAAPSVVNIYTRKLPKRQHPLYEDPLFKRFFENSDRPEQQRLQSALGSGVILDQDGHILTNHHVVNNADEIVVLLFDGRESRAEIIGSDPDTDLTVLKINLTDLTPVKIGDPHSARVGDIVLAIGNPFGVGQTVTQGIISAIGRYGLGLNTYENCIQTDAAINPGNSGGALIDNSGRLIGINTAIIDRSWDSVGIGFAIPADMAFNVMRHIIQYGQVIRGWLGLEARAVTETYARDKGLPYAGGVVITSMADQGPAQQSGLKKGDILLRINGRTIGNGRPGMHQIAATHPGDEVAVDLLRNGKPLTIMVKVGMRPSVI